MGCEYENETKTLVLHMLRLGHQEAKANTVLTQCYWPYLSPGNEGFLTASLSSWASAAAPTTQRTAIKQKVMYFAIAIFCDDALGKRKM